MKNVKIIFGRCLLYVQENGVSGILPPPRRTAFFETQWITISFQKKQTISNSWLSITNYYTLLPTLYFILKNCTKWEPLIDYLSVVELDWVVGQVCTNSSLLQQCLAFIGVKWRALSTKKNCDWKKLKLGPTYKQTNWPTNQPMDMSHWEVTLPKSKSLLIKR